MKRLSEFTGDAAFDVVADLFPYLAEIARNPESRAASTKSNLEFAAALLKHNKAAIKGILARLNEVPVEEYTCTAVSLINDALTLVTDPDLMALFGRQSKTPASSGSVSETTEAPAE